MTPTNQPQDRSENEAAEGTLPNFEMGLWFRTQLSAAIQISSTAGRREDQTFGRVNLSAPGDKATFTIDFRIFKFPSMISN